MTPLKIKNILIPTDFSKTASLAIEHAAFMARLYKANLYLLHVIEIAEVTYTVYNPAVQMVDFDEIQKRIDKQLSDLAIKLKKEYAITVHTICARGQATSEVVSAVKKNDIDLVIMGTHGVSGFDEVFLGSNAHKVTTICPCPVITVQSHAKKIGFTDIILPIDDSMHSRQKVDNAILLAKKYAATIHILGLIEKGEDTNPKKFEIKIESVEKIIKKNKIAYETKIVKGENLAVEAMKYAKKVKADLIMVMADHESHLKGMFFGAFTKQIVNHSKIPVMSIKPIEGYFNSLELTGASPY